MTEVTDAMVSLVECPIGLFFYEHEHGRVLCLKTEYGNNKGRIDAYIVASGEFFWGAAPQTIASQRAQMVRPVPLAAVEAALAARPEPEGMETADEDIAILNRVAEVGILGTDPARVGRFVRDFNRLRARLAEAEATEARLRAALAVSKDPCVYCSLPAEEFAKCSRGFPGCARADDEMGCPELGALMTLHGAEAENASLKARLTEAETEKVAAVAAEREQCALIALSVRDTGGGIAAEKVARAIRARGGEHG